MPRDLILVGSHARNAGRVQSRTARALPAGFGLLIGAGVSVALWVGAIRLAIGLFS